MLYLGGVVGFALLALWVFCLVDVILTPEGSAAIFRSWRGC